MTDFKELREALDAGPTDGNWQVSGRFNEWSISSDHSVRGPCLSGRQFVASCFRVSKKDTPAYAKMFEANARYIAAANPAVIRSLLAELDAARKDAERYRFIRDADRSDRAISFQALLSLAMDSLDAAIDSAMKEQQP